MVFNRQTVVRQATAQRAAHQGAQSPESAARNWGSSGKSSRAFLSPRSINYGAGWARLSSGSGDSRLVNQEWLVGHSYHRVGK